MVKASCDIAERSEDKFEAVCGSYVKKEDVICWGISIESVNKVLQLSLVADELLAGNALHRIHSS